MLHNDKQIPWNAVVLSDTSGPTADLSLPTDFATGPRVGQTTLVDLVPGYALGLDSLRDVLLCRNPSVGSRCCLMKH